MCSKCKTWVARVVREEESIGSELTSGLQLTRARANEDGERSE